MDGAFGVSALSSFVFSPAASTRVEVVQFAHEHEHTPPQSARRSDAALSHRERGSPLAHLESSQLSCLRRSSTDGLRRWLRAVARTSGEGDTGMGEGGAAKALATIERLLGTRGTGARHPRRATGGARGMGVGRARAG